MVTHRKSISSKAKDSFFVWSILIPAILFFLIFIYYPFFKNIYYVFTDYNYIKKPSFIGLENINKLFSDPYAFTALKNTFIITLVTVPVIIIISLLLSVALFNLKKCKGFIRSSIFSTYLIPLVVASIIFKLIFSTESGILNNLLSYFNIQKVDWLTNPTNALICIILVNLWNGTGYYLVIFLAGLSNINRQIYEAAKIDGAGAVRTFFSITVPQLKPTMIFAIIFATISYLRTYVIVEVLTEGGPYRSTETIIKYMFDQGFKSRHVGYASLLAIVLFIITLIISIIQLKITKYDEK